MQLVSRKPAEAAPSRIQPLAKLPVFFDLAGKRAVVVGGSAAAAWKCELLAAAGSQVNVYAQELGPEMVACIATMTDDAITHRAQTWTPEIFSAAAIAVCDIGDEAEAAACAAVAQAAGVPVNVIDKPALCDFQFGSIVNRSPVVIGISTDGAAPILAQAIRRRIETLLPPWLSRWGALARELRATVSARLAKGAPRRRFWERFAQRAFAAPPADHERAHFAGLVDQLALAMPGARAQQAGHVTLVGAGPGDAELLTLKAVRALQSADVILYDDLVATEVIELARREAKRMMVGKRGKRESCRQEDINELMIKLARQGKHVVRLKSGDPMIFGRAGEEIAELEKHGISVTAVPGVTAALAAASVLGVSLTHRDHAHSVRFVTGHTRNGELSDDLDWRGLADPQTTLVFYMGGRTAQAIGERLLAAGLPSSTPVIIASSISRPDETRWCGQLSDLAGGIALIDYSQPVLIGIGRAFATAAVGSVSKPIHNRSELQPTSSLPFL